VTNLVDLPLPRLADTVVEGTITRWLRPPGEAVRKGEPLVEIETDKVTSELEAPADGVLAEVLVAEGQTVPVGQVLARIATSGEGALQGAPLAPPAAGSPISQLERAGARDGGLSPTRRRIAERVLEARATIPQGACVREVDLSGMRRDRQSWTAFFVKALSAATGISDVGVAVEIPDGLVVPVVRGAHGLDVNAISELVADLAARAREGRLEPAEVSGGGITVTNVGGGGTLMAFPLVNPGQPAILATGAVRPDGRCYLTLCYDRRRYDDYAADRLLAAIEEELLKLSAPS
jgi:2-oxoglutarate dehydrogenase E2 component (dihydrolipoamide succinyltransferase)